MTTKFVKRFKSVMACVAILALGAIIVVVWVQFSQGSFSNKRQFTSINATTPSYQEDKRIFNGTKHKEFIGKTHLEDIETNDVEFVKPLRISSTLESHGGPLLRHHNGNFRHKQAEEWDLHPRYQIVAFGQTLVLDLDYNDKFVSPNLHVVTQFGDDTQKAKHDPRISGCFYIGKVKGDKESSVAVSLCNGMTGYIRTSDSSYYIEPAEVFHNGSTGSLIHRMKRVPLPTKDFNDINSMEFYENSENLTIIEDDFYQETAHIPKEHLIQKREIPLNPWSQDIEGTCDVVEEKYWKKPEYTRKTRNAEWTSKFRMSNESFVKVLVVADESMVKYHLNDDELTHYILILMSHVSFLFKDETIGNAISVSVVQIMVLRNVNFSNTYSSGMLLKFCNWTKQNIRDKSHNVAVLLTRDTICRNESVPPQRCTTLGVAEVGSMCQSGCAIVRDKGLASSYTIAHEIGHILSMPHDEDGKCQQLNKDISISNIMSKVIEKDTKPFTWSPCSRYFITEFLDSNRASCLQKPPTNNYITYTYTEILPGDKFDLNAQCELEFGPGRKVCLAGKPCEHLYCSTDNSEYPCISTFSPWADGTKCGEGRVCFNGECTFEQEYKPIDGGWGPWQEFGPCSRTCGGGIKKSHRYCTSPKPVNGGSYCIGENERYESCNSMDCDANSLEFRAVQCSDFDGITKDFPNLSNGVQWYPEYNLERPEDYCRLYCLPNNVKPSYRLKDKVLDGTKCGPSGFGICVNGICKPGGCDNILDSTVVLDDCGICGGDNSRCQEISGTYNKPADVSGYNRVVRIPKGSSNLNITQNSYPYIVDENYLVLIDGETGDPILNGNYMANTDGLEVKFGNINLNYSGASSTIEWIISPKNRKLPKDLVISVLSVGKLSPPDIRYRYVIDIKEAPRYPRYYLSNYRGYVRRYGWRLYQKEWSKCNSICEGKQYRKPSCVELITGEEVPKSYCDNMEDSLTQKQECNTHCELTWNIASKSACSPQCGKGIRRIYYDCMKVYKKKPSHSETVNEKHCTVLSKPPVLETCNTLCNSTRWHYSSWSECSKTCGSGIQSRTAKCVDDRYTPMDDSYCNNSEMITQQICNTENCPIWTVADTSPCSAPCGGGYKNISYYCVLDGRIFEQQACDINTKPPEKESCNEQACGRWTPLNIYHSCSVTCGEGVEKRKFICTKFNSKDILDSSYCRDQPIPNESRVCYRPECEERRIRIKDDYNNIMSPESYNMKYKWKWVPDNWSACSQSCGTGGRSKQLFRCIDDIGNQNDLMCDTNLRPNNVVQCNNIPCPKWITGGWSPSCDSNCEKYRQVRCIGHSGTILNDNDCDDSLKPENNTKCKLTECPYISNTVNGRYFDSSETGDKRYRWKVGPWKKCSNSCGKGTRRRHIGCEDALNEIMVVDSFCRNLKRPKQTKPCAKYVCKYAWIDSYWSDCSASCGNGLKTRNVTCHRVHHGGVIDPIPLPDLYQNKIHHQNYCSVYNKPPITAKCLLSYCDDQYIWQPGPWRGCSHKCGRKGRQTRVISCVNVRTKQKVHQNFCRKNLKPRRKRKCNQWRCLYKNCRELKYYMKTKINKDYVISVNGRPVQIYCYKMDTPEPQEYITLHSDGSNFAEIYDKRLIDIRSCPYDGQRRDNCHCDQIGPRSGFTKFWKVRLNITSMQIIGSDFTFSKQLKGTHIPFGTAGDCYSSIEGCAQGKFSIDLAYTSFKLSSKVRWETLGSYASAEIHKTETSASGKCGGYCGNCMPDPNVGLAVEIT
ncbi:ADAM metallopeptidase with thrombospondin type 1 motif A isoform X3 [Leptinotarsa decemlineata]|uniref:ADAM metallopeptidase with thrombospondin type 1 motif A isoform X3 n=1 Tax=Leptinotarsa decemlineata TaxID=7539 RepID=UPI003D307B1E